MAMGTIHSVDPTAAEISYGDEPTTEAKLRSVPPASPKAMLLGAERPFVGAFGGLQHRDTKKRDRPSWLTPLLQMSFLGTDRSYGGPKRSRSHLSASSTILSTGGLCPLSSRMRFLSLSAVPKSSKNGICAGR